MRAIFRAARAGRASRRGRLKSRVAAVLVAGVVTSAVAMGAPDPLAVSSAQASLRASVPRAGYGEGPGFCSSAVPGGYTLPKADPPASFDNVYACGPASNRGTGYEVPASGSYAGFFEDSYYEFQCVELANRFVFDIWGLQPIKGKSLDGADYAATLSSERSVQLEKNGTAGQPYLPGDIVSFTGSGAQADGHVAVVMSSTYAPGDGGTYSVTLLQENASPVVASAKVAGWSMGDPSGSRVTPRNFDAIDAIWGKAFEVPGIAALDAGGSADVISISCPSPGNCSAGGQYATAKNEDAAFVVNEVNGVWSKAQKVTGTAAGGAINSISCASAGNCSAGGENYPKAFVVSAVNGIWGKAEVVPGAAAAGIDQSSVSSVSCGSAGNCSAGGYYSNGASNETFVVSQAGGRWGHLMEVPGTPALNTGGDATVQSVSCGSAGNCSAGGSYQDAAGTQAFVVSQAHGTWGTAIEVPGTATLNASGYAVVESMSCASAGACSAGGLYSTGSIQEAFVVDRVNGTWGTASKVRGTPGGAVWLSSVSCASPGNCSAGGYYGVAGGAEAFVASETNGAWGTAANVPGTHGTGDEVTTISCASAGNCSAGGGSTGDQAFVVNQTDGILGTAGPVRGLGSGGSVLYSISCPAAGNCAAGGSYINSAGKDQAFVVTKYGG
jgi:hypothetical protein